MDGARFLRSINSFATIHGCDLEPQKKKDAFMQRRLGFEVLRFDGS